MQVEMEDRHMGRVVRTSIGTVAYVSIKFVEKGTSLKAKMWLGI